MRRAAGHGDHGGGHRLDSLLPFPEALARVMAVARPVEGMERVRIDEAAGRLAATDVQSTIDVPAADRASMDGYAVRAADTQGATPRTPVELRCTSAIFAGEVPKDHVGAGTCIQVATGVTVPRGADAVVQVELTERIGEIVHVRSSVAAGRNVSARGEDIRRGSVVVRRGDLLTPGKAGALTAVGRTSARVFRRPRVAILTTGNEVVEPGARLRPGQVYDINAYTIAAVARENGGEPRFLGRVRDDPADLRRALGRAASQDIVVVSGGSSVGEKDLLVDVLKELGEVLFHGIAVKPGRPTILGRIGATPVLGMPGFATSCLSNSYVLLAPALRAMARLPARPPRVVELPLSEAIESPKGRTEFHTVRVEDGLAVPAFKESSAITSMAHADGYVEIPAEVERIEKGERVRVLLF